MMNDLSNKLMSWTSGMQNFKLNIARDGDTDQLNVLMDKKMFFLYDLAND